MTGRTIAELSAGEVAELTRKIDEETVAEFVDATGDDNPIHSDPEFAAMYEVLRQAQEAGVAAVRPGVTAASVDAACREPITAAGYGERFLHRTGHGIGLDEHEDPYIVAGNDEVLEPGMAFSVEPGIYLSGRHGARIEDILVVTETGADSLNREPHGDSFELYIGIGQAF